MKTDKQMAAAAAKFAERWKDKGYERGQSQPFWMDLLTNVFGVETLSTGFIQFEVHHKVDSSNFIDASIPSTRVLIEQKSLGKDLRKGTMQSDGKLLTPFEQARRYIVNLPYSQHPRWIVTCNFSEFLVYDMEHPNAQPEEIFLSDLSQEFYRLKFLVDIKRKPESREERVSIDAGKIVGKIYDALIRQYDDGSAQALRWLNILCVRMVFCLYAEDAGVFTHNQFHDYLVRYDAEDLRNALIRLFEVLNTPEDKRSKYLKDDLKAFPYTSGGLFEEEIEIPQFTEEMKRTLLENASLEFDWSQISPTIFGAVFESTLNPETRRNDGMHYTSIQNIHKVIDPLFLNDLHREFKEILEDKVEKQRMKKLDEFQNRIASLTFLDPACGSGNFLTETYLSLRRLENEVIRERYHGQTMMGVFINPIKVSIGQFYGIEINDFAVTVATTALWISESQMLAETERIIHQDIEFLPLKDYANIVEGNALRTDWATIVPKEKLNYIMGNPPFVGFTYMSAEQKKDLGLLFPGIRNLDYVSCWYKKTNDFIRNTNIECAFVSTNSVAQGETVGRMWEQLDMTINFAYPTFRWDNEASLKAHVHCVIIGFSNNSRKHKYIIDKNGAKECKNINPYLVDAPNIIVKSRSKPLCKVPPMIYGNKPVDGGYLIFTKSEKEDFLRQEPKAKKWIYSLIGGTELINNKPKTNDKLRYTLWLEGITPSELKTMPKVLERISRVKETRLKSPATAIQKFAETPYLYAQRTQPNIPKLDENGYPLKQNGQEHFNLVVPEVSSEKRKYIPFGFMPGEVVTNNLVKIIPDATLYHFGVLESNVHMDWMRAVCGRLKSDYRYSKDIVYNNFPWPSPTNEQKAKIEQTAQAILDARAKYPDSSLADLYDELTMPVELRRAHEANDRAVMQAYGFAADDSSESQLVAELFKLYQKLTQA